MASRVRRYAIGFIADRHFRFNWQLTAFSLFFLALFFNLGFWQLDRAKEKQQQLDQAASTAALPPLTASQWLADQSFGRRAQLMDSVAGVDDLQPSAEQPSGRWLQLTDSTDGIYNLQPLAVQSSGRRVQLSGQFVPDDYWLLDNRVLDGRVGFEVIHRFELQPVMSWLASASPVKFFINRGFVPMGMDRSDLPEVSVPPGLVSLITLARLPTEEAYVLGGADESEGRIIQSYADLPLDAFVMLLEEGSPGALPRHWPATNMTPERHQGYALQWFIMALVLSLAWLVFSFPKSGPGAGQAKHEKDKMASNL